MTKQEEQDMLFELFGLCPDYEVYKVEGEWVEYYEPTTTNFKDVPTYDYHKSEYEKGVDSIFYPNSIRLHLNVHTVENEDGISIMARFAVSHPLKRIFLLVTPMGEFGRITKYDWK